MKNNFYLKHQLMARHDSRMELMYDTEGPKGIGVYWMIVEILAMFPESTATIKDVHRHLKLYKISKSYITKIIFAYELFDLFENDYISAAELNSSRLSKPKSTKLREKATTLKKEEATVYAEENQKTKRTEEKKSASTTPNNIVSATKNNTEQCTVYDENRSKNDELNSFSDAKMHENRPKTLEQSPNAILARATNSLILSDLRKTNAGIKENIRDIKTTTTTEKEKEKIPAVVDDDANRVLGIAEKVIADADDNFEEVCLSKFKQVVCPKESAAFVANEILNSGNCVNQHLPTPNAVCGAEKRNSQGNEVCKRAIHWADYAFGAVDACCKQTVDSLCNPTLQLGKCHTRAQQMPQLSWANATCHAPPSVALQLLSCGHRCAELWGFANSESL